MLIREPGVETTISDPNGQVTHLLDLLDGDHTLDQLTDSMRERWPELTTADVAEGLASLDAAGLLEDAGLATLDRRERERYQSNLEFFGTFAGFATSRDSFQERLRESNVALLGVGGIGSAVLCNLVGLGVGRVTIVDHDRVERSNLSRQFLYVEDDVGSRKIDRAAARAKALNPEIDLVTIDRRLSSSNDLADVVTDADLVVSAIDRPPRIQYEVNDACVAAGVPYVNGAVWATRGYYYSIRPGSSGCLRCHEIILERSGSQIPEPVLANRATGPTANLIGSLVATEALRYLTGFAEPVASATVWVTDFLGGTVGVGYAWPKLDECSVCSLRPRVDLS